MSVGLSILASRSQLVASNKFLQMGQEKEYEKERGNLGKRERRLLWSSHLKAGPAGCKTFFEKKTWLHSPTHTKRANIDTMYRILISGQRLQKVVMLN